MNIMLPSSDKVYGKKLKGDVRVTESIALDLASRESGLRSYYLSPNLNDKKKPIIQRD